MRSRRCSSRPSESPRRRPRRVAGAPSPASRVRAVRRGML
jgi:hypothetical protein